MEDGLYFRWTKVSVALVITLVIIASNTINLIVLYRMRDIGRRMKILLMSLCTSDLCLGLFVCMPGVISGVLSYWPFGPVMCQITGTMNGVAISVSLWSLMAIGVERYLVMKKSGVSKRKKNPTMVCLCVAFIWIFNTLFFGLPIAWEPNYIYYHYDPDVLTCSFTWKHTWHFMFAKFLYPALSGTVIVFTSWQVRKPLPEPSLDEGQVTHVNWPDISERQRKAKALLLCTTTVFFIAISPYSISSLLEHFLPDLTLPPWLRFLALWTLCTNCLMNVFIYSAVYTEFRNHCKHLF
ncbi:hypothetical protein EGW08_002956, partial [Elysia chlorotica]